jgi:hypothetical protein
MASIHYPSSRICRMGGRKWVGIMRIETGQGKSRILDRLNISTASVQLSSVELNLATDLLLL